MPTRTQYDKLSKKLRNARKKLKTWPAVNKALYDGKIGTTDLSRIANPKDDHWPKKKAIRDLLIAPPKDTDISWRVLHIKATKAELHEIQNTIKPRARTKRLLS